MKIILLSEIDYAGSGHKLSEAINRHTNHDVRIFTGKYYNPYGHPDNSKWNKREVQRLIDNCDIVHLKGDFPPVDGYLGLRIMHKPVIITVSGSHFRKKEYGGHGRHNVLQYKKAVVRTSFEPDLLYPEYGGIWTPHPINSTDKPIMWRRQEPPILMHMATNPDAKASWFIKKVFNRLKKNIRALIYLPKPMGFMEAVAARQVSTIYFDQFKVGFYGNSALEAMQYGIPVAAWISTLSEEQGFDNHSPVISTHKEVDAWVHKIEIILNSDMDKLSRETKQWCDEVHSYEAVAKQWNTIYESI